MVILSLSTGSEVSFYQYLKGKAAAGTGKVFAHILLSLVKDTLL